MLFECDSVPCDHSPVEGYPGLRAVPFDEITNGMVVQRFELEDVRLFKTADFDCSRSGNLRTVFGTRLRLLFAIGSGLRCRGEKRDPVPELLTSSAFHRLMLSSVNIGR